VKPSSRAAERQRRYRQRRNRGEVILRLVVPHDVVVEALLEARRLDDEASCDMRMVERESADVLLEWSAKWLKNRNA
jgi:hypothetical protein